MRLCLLAFCFAWLSLVDALAQQVLWERRIGWPDDDFLTTIVDLEDGTYLACGSSYRAREAGNPTRTPCVVACRFTAWGDTNYCVNTGLYFNPGQARLLRLSTGKVYVTGYNRNFFERNRLAELDPETGLALWERDLQGMGFSVAFNSTLIEGPDRSLILVGTTQDTTSLASAVGYLARYDTLGNLVWATYLREHSSYTLLNHVEMTALGTILASGTAGSRVWATEFTADGAEFRRATFYTTPTRFIFDGTAAVRQAPDDRYLVAGTTQQNPSRVYLGMHQGWGGPALWGSETIGVLGAIQTLADTGVVYYQGGLPDLALTRLRTDGTRGWQHVFVNRPDQVNTILYALQNLADESGIVAGVQRFRDSTGRDFYLARLTNMGIPYRPWQPATATKAKASQPAPRPYPNPCSGSLHFAGLNAPGRLELYGTDGRLHLSQPVAPGQPIDISALPPGVYGYVLTVQGKSWRGRIVKS